MKARSTIAAVVVLTLVGQTPSSAHAQMEASAGEPATDAAAIAPVQLIVDAPAPIDLRTNDVWRTSYASNASNAPLVSWFAAKPAPIRLSKAAITWIIIGGVVLLVLVVGGVAVIGKPGRVH